MYQMIKNLSTGNKMYYPIVFYKGREIRIRRRFFNTATKAVECAKRIEEKLKNFK